jgi:hypothetical protein
MTQALCLRCGAIKFGALCPCAACQAPASGDPQLDICFSDHHLHRESLAELGAVIQAIRRVETEDELIVWAFLAYISEHHPHILSIALEPDIAPRVEKILSQVDLPEVTLRPADRNDLCEPVPIEELEPPRRWWQFWKRRSSR